MSISPDSGGAAAPPPDTLDPRWVGAAIYREHWHFHRQLLGRYKIVLAPGEFSMIVTAIETGRALLIERRGAKKAIYSIRVPSVGERIFILSSGQNVITAWPPDKRLSAIRRALTTAVSQATADE